MADLDLIRRAISDPGQFTKRERDPGCDTHNCTCESVPAWCARSVVIALAGQRASELAALALWIEEDAAGEDQEIADYARGIAARIRDRAAAQPGENGDTWCCAKCKKLAEEGL